MAAHAVEVFIWALAYLIVGVVPGKAGFVYFAFVNYTTLGFRWNVGVCLALLPP